MLYRFKTEEEFIEEYGENWLNHPEVFMNGDGEMNYLLGTPIKIDVDLEKFDKLSFITTTPRKYDSQYTWDIYKHMLMLKPLEPSYKPRKLDRTLENMSFIYEKVLYAFDFDDTLVYSNRFEEHIRPLLNEFLTPEIILKNKVNDININISDLKYENGRVYFDDPKQLVNITNNPTWVRKKDRVYITQPESYYLTSESMPVGTYNKIVDIYNKSKYKTIITARKERLRNQTIEALDNLGIEMPNYGLFMYPDDSIIFSSKWKANKLIDLYNNNNFTHIHYFDDNMKLLKRIKSSIKGYKDKITLYKVTENNYRKI